MSVAILTGDAASVLRGLPADTFQACVTSPPYFGLRDYGVEGQIGLEDTPDAFVARLVDVFREVRRVLRPDGTFWLNIGDSYASAGGHQVRQSKWPVEGAHDGQNGGETRRPPDGIKAKDLIGIPWMLAFALRADGWWLRQEIIWHKPNAMPSSVRDRCTSAHEHVFLLSKSAKYAFYADAIAEPATVADWDDGSRVFGGRAKHGANAKHGERTTGRVAGRKVRRADSANDSHVPGASPHSGLHRAGTDREPQTRNARDVWRIPTQPFSAKRVPGWEEDHDHYAVMPPDLAERCIKAGTSERGQCPHCGSPWIRQVERETRPNWTGGDGQKHDGTHYRPNPGGGVGNDRREAREVGWSPSCDCPEHQPVAQHVLDPFGGAGTTGLVADRLGRSATLIELNPKNARLARARINAEVPLMAAAE